MTHVPYKGAGPALIDLAAGQIDVMISNYSSLVPQMKSGKVRAIAVTSPKPSPAFPDLPPVAAAVPGYAMDIWVTVFRPRRHAGAAGRAPRTRKSTRISAFRRSCARLPRSRRCPPGRAGKPAAIAARLKQELAQLKKIAAERQISLD
jgi:hypothetical protein